MAKPIASTEGKPAKTPLIEAMELTGSARDTRMLEAAEESRLEMEGLASKLRDLILSTPPEELLGYLWGSLLVSGLKDSALAKDANSDAAGQMDSVLVALEYVHAVLSCFVTGPEVPERLNEALASEIVTTAGRLRELTGLYCILSSTPAQNDAFGDETRFMAHLAKSTWTLIRGHRYQVLEEEFFRFVLNPHDDALRSAYGTGASEIAMGIQSISNSMREGHSHGFNEVYAQMESTHSLADEHGLSIEEAIEKVKTQSPEAAATLQGAFKDMFYGGLCNLSRHTKLPETFLEDLSFDRGENSEFFEPGPFCGTLLRTLPARIKPLVRLEEGFYATDPQFVRDAAYRAIQRGLLKRLPGYSHEWNQKQKTLSESAFSTILESQLKGASVLTEIYYRDPISGEWVENDTLILVDDVLIQVEAKAGIGAMHSPATNFGNHVRAIQALVVKAYMQTRRFLEYLSSAPEVPLYELRDGQYAEVHRLRLSDFRLVVPMGLTVESFAPFSTMCKDLPDVEAILGKYPFVSISIDELFVLNRFLPTAGMLFHYLEVRQQVAGIRRTVLFDETDYLGAYIAKNRIDLTLREQLAEGANVVTWDAFSQDIDRYFEGDRWLHESPPAQPYPEELQQVFAALAKTRAPGWLRVDALIRDFSSDARSKLGAMLKELSATLNGRDRRWFCFGGDRSLLVWLERDGTSPNVDAAIRQAEVVGLAMKSLEMQMLMLSVTSSRDFTGARGLSVQTPTELRADYQELLAEAKALEPRLIPTKHQNNQNARSTSKKKPRPNEPCWCGSGRKFKKCHGPTS